MANEYKILCSEANKMVKMKDGATTSNGWTKIDGEYDRDSNFKAVLYEKDGRQLYINDGIGYVLYPMRIGTYPEVTLIVLRHGADSQAKTIRP